MRHTRPCKTDSAIVRILRPFAIVTFGAAVSGCSREPPPSPRVAAEASAPVVAPPVEVRVDAVDVPGDLPAFVLRGAIGGEHAVFIHGMCAHAQGFMQSFQFAASRYGTLVGIQGDIDCGGGLRRWSSDLGAMERRLRIALQVAGVGDPSRLTLIGYSQGAERIEWLHTKHPARYPRLVIMSGPISPRPDRLRGAESVALLAGTREGQTLMREAAIDLPKRGIRASYFPLPFARHGEMGTEAETALGNALNWLGESKNVAGGDAGLSHSKAPNR